MGILKKASQYVKARAGEAEDPRETLEYSYQQQLNMLAKVQQGAADAAASRAAVEMQLEKLRQEQADLDRQIAADAEAGAGARGRDSQASRAQRRKAQLDGRLSQLAAKYDSLRELEERLAGAGENLKLKVEAFRVRMEAIIKAFEDAAEA